MAHYLHRLTPFLRSTPVMRNRCGVATAAQGRHHPNPGNFANRPKEELSAIGHRGGKKGGKARGVGGFHEMDPEKQVRQGVIMHPGQRLISFHSIKSPRKVVVPKRKVLQKWRKLSKSPSDASPRCLEVVLRSLRWYHQDIQNGRPALRTGDIMHDRFQYSIELSTYQNEM